MRTDQRIRRTYDIAGIVQGVGFRPSLFRAACAAGLSGSVQNRSGGVRVVLEGPETTVRDFIHNLPSALPDSARIASIREIGAGTACAGDGKGFHIVESRSSLRTDVVIPADLSACAACLTEIRSPESRRFGYPFTTCTDCGPRYTVIQRMPYDRSRTTLSDFALCEACRREYENPQDRRFHAETIACPACGPQWNLESGEGESIPGDPLRRARAALAGGRIIAVRSIGGYLLAADAFCEEALRELRRRKRRPDKPFAVMAANLEVAQRLCRAPAAAAAMLTSTAAPIVILDADLPAVNAAGLPLDLITPDSPTLGVMLPCSPLHDLLSRPLPGDPVPRFDCLVMTSGNRGGEPICLTNSEARERLHGIADLFLVHNREITLRNDDSVCVIRRGAPQVWRRARGFAPQPVQLQRPLSRCVLAMGGRMKAAIALGYDRRVVLSPHLGDLETEEALKGFETVTQSLPRFLDRRPECVAVDLHPDMASTRAGSRLADSLDVPVHRVQHHLAHAAACMAEHGEEHALALVFDGTGFGPDGTIWGAECLEVGPGIRKRWATFAGTPLPGGDAAIRRPARQLLGRLHDAGLSPSDELLDRLGVSAAEARAWASQCRSGLNCPTVHSAGRLFDAFAVLLDLAPRSVTYDAQAAIRLEAAARNGATAALPPITYGTAEDNGMLTVCWKEVFRQLAQPAPPLPNREAWALAFHAAVADAAVTMLRFALDHTACRTVVLSGGVFMNRILTNRVYSRLQRDGLTVRLHRETPPNDGCIACGQAVLAGQSDRETQSTVDQDTMKTEND